MRLTKKRSGVAFNRRSNSSIVGGVVTPRKRPKSASLLYRRANAANTTNSENLPFNMKRIVNSQKTRPSSAKVEDLEAEVENLRGQLLKLKLDNANQTRENSLIKFIGSLFKQSVNHNDDIINFLSKFQFSDKDTTIINGILGNNIMALKMLLNEIGESDFTQLEIIFDKVGFEYEKLETPGLMSTPVTGEATPSPTPKDPKKELERWEGKRRAAHRFKKGKNVKIPGNDREFTTTIRPDGTLTVTAALPRTVIKLPKSDKVIHVNPPPRSRKKETPGDKGSGSRKKKLI
jgi:hypothetical protein